MGCKRFHEASPRTGACGRRRVDTAATRVANGTARPVVSSGHSLCDADAMTQAEKRGGRSGAPVQNAMRSCEGTAMGAAERDRSRETALWELVAATSPQGAERLHFTMPLDCAWSQSDAGSAQPVMACFMVAAVSMTPAAAADPTASICMAACPTWCRGMLPAPAIPCSGIARITSQNNTLRSEADIRAVYAHSRPGNDLRRPGATAWRAHRPSSCSCPASGQPRSGAMIPSSRTSSVRMARAAPLQRPNVCAAAPGASSTIVPMTRR